MLIYGSTDTDVLGYASLSMEVSSGDKILISKQYNGTAKERKAKINCDTPSTYREMAAKAVADALSRFKTDLQAL